jgi:membrane-bound metal-dependent hydrolase YbcI (DUF457 family)
MSLPPADSLNSCVILYSLTNSTASTPRRRFKALLSLQSASTLHDVHLLLSYVTVYTCAQHYRWFRTRYCVKPDIRYENPMSTLPMAYKITRYKLQTPVFQRLFFYRHRRHSSHLFMVSVFRRGVNETGLLGCYTDVSEQSISLILKSLWLLDLWRWDP